jgi:hypothetical protein
MVAPVFVGASTVYNASNVWPSTLTINTSDLPAGSAVGDRIVLFVTDYYVQGIRPTVEPTLSQFGGLTGWDYIDTTGYQTLGFSINTYTQMWVYTTRRTATTFPLTIEPQTSTGTPITPNVASGQRYYRAAVAAWSPSAGFRAGASAKNNQPNGPTLAPDSSISVDGVGSGIFVEANFLNFNDMGSVVTASGYTLRYTQSSSPLYGGSLTISDKPFSTSGASNYIVFNKPTGYYAGNINFALDVADPSLNGWSVGRIKY